jgi:hypothetical protein
MSSIVEQLSSDAHTSKVREKIDESIKADFELGLV